MKQIKQFICRQCIARTCIFRSEDSIGTPPKPIWCPLGIINGELNDKSKWEIETL